MSSRVFTMWSRALSIDQSVIMLLRLLTSRNIDGECGTLILMDTGARTIGRFPIGCYLKVILICICSTRKLSVVPPLGIVKKGATDAILDD